MSRVLKQCRPKWLAAANSCIYLVKISNSQVWLILWMTLVDLWTGWKCDGTQIIIKSVKTDKGMSFILLSLLSAHIMTQNQCKNASGEFDLSLLRLANHWLGFIFPGVLEGLGWNFQGKIWCRGMLSQIWQRISICERENMIDGRSPRILNRIWCFRSSSATL